MTQSKDFTSRDTKSTLDQKRWRSDCGRHYRSLINDDNLQAADRNRSHGVSERTRDVLTLQIIVILCGKSYKSDVLFL